MAVGGTSSLGISDLQVVLDELKQGVFSWCNWRQFGSKAGLYKNTLDEIEESKTKVEDRLEECLSCWLKRKDDVDKQGKPSWRRLAEILEELGDRAMADTIRGRKLRKDVSSDVHKEQQVEPVTTPGHSIFLPKYLKYQYLQMAAKFANILKRFVIQIFKEREKLKDVKMSLVGISPSNKKEINEVHDETDLIQVLRDYCSLSEFHILISLAEDMKMADITEELNQFEKKQNELYKEILAKDFARSAIEYCGTTGSREITFEVSWPIDKATLYDFQEFLAAAFSSQDYYIHIHLKTVHN